MKIKINDIEYKVEMVEKLDALGIFYGDDQTIKIRKNLKAKLYNTIKHELTHAYLYSYGFSQVKLNEEVVCDFFETYGEKIIIDSKKLYENLRKGENNGK